MALGVRIAEPFFPSLLQPGRKLLCRSLRKPLVVSRFYPPVAEQQLRDVAESCHSAELPGIFLDRWTVSQVVPAWRWMSHGAFAQCYCACALHVYRAHLLGCCGSFIPLPCLTNCLLIYCTWRTQFEVTDNLTHCRARIPKAS